MTAKISWSHLSLPTQIIQVDLLSSRSLIISAKRVFFFFFFCQIRSQSQFLRVRTPEYLLGDHHSNNYSIIKIILTCGPRERIVGIPTVPRSHFENLGSSLTVSTHMQKQSPSKQWKEGQICFPKKLVKIKFPGRVLEERFQKKRW